MRNSLIFAALATAGTIVTAPASGQIRVGGQGGVGVGGSVRVGVPRVETPRIDTRVGVDARTRVDGPAAVDLRARNRTRAGVGVNLPDHLLGLRTGLVVRNRAGVRVGTVSRIVTSADGTVRSVLVARARGQGHLRLAPDALRVDGNVVTTSAVRLNR